MTPQALSDKLHALGMKHASVEQSVACKGTVIEKRTLTARRKAFLFLGPKDAMLKLSDSIPESQALSKKDPEHFRAGSGGWTKIMFEDGKLPMDVMKRWIAESYSLYANAKPAAKPKTAKKKPRRKPAK